MAKEIYIEIKETFRRAVKVTTDSDSLSIEEIIEEVEELYLAGETEQLSLAMEDYSGEFSIVHIESPSELTAATIPKISIGESKKVYTREDLGIILLTESHDPKTIRYFIAGVPDAEGKVSGIVHDYLGGGERDETCAFEGVLLEVYPELDAEDRLEELMGEGFVALCQAYIEEFIEYNESNMTYRLRKETVERMSTHGKTLRPIDYGNTIWEEN